MSGTITSCIYYFENLKADKLELAFGLGSYMGTDSVLHSFNYFYNKITLRENKEAAGENINS